MFNHEMEWTFERADGTHTVTLEYSVAPLIPAQTYGPPEDCYPAEGGEVTAMQATDENGEVVSLTTDEQSRAMDYIEMKHEYDTGGGYEGADEYE